MVIDVAEYGGKWIAIKKEKIIGSDKTLKQLMKQINYKENDINISFMPVPKGYIVGDIHEIPVPSI